MINCSNIWKEDAHVKRDIEFSLMYGTILMFIKFNNFGSQYLNGPRHLLHSFCWTKRCIFEPLHVYDPSFNTDQYGTYSRQWKQY